MKANILLDFLLGKSVTVSTTNVRSNLDKALIMQISNHNIPPRNTLLKLWEITFGHPAPSGAHTNFLYQAVSWQHQARQCGGLSSSEQKQLLNNKLIASTLPIGTSLVRVWQGETHQVTVVKDGFTYAGEQWKSLSVIASKITGTHWSGPAFFGLNK